MANNTSKNISFSAKEQRRTYVPVEFLDRLKTDFHRVSKAGVFHVLVLVVGVKGASTIQQAGLARILDKDELGMAVYVLRILSMICVAADLGISTSILKFASEPESESKRRQIYRTGIAYTAWISLGISLLYVLAVLGTNAFGNGSEMVYPLLLGAIYIPLRAIRKLPPLYMQARKEIKKASTISGITTLLLVGIVLGFAYYFRVWGFLWALVLGQLFALTIFLIYTKSHLVRVKADFRVFKKLLHLGFFSMLGNFCTIANATLAFLMLQGFGFGYEALATYGIATTVMEGIRLIPQSLMRTVFPYLVASKSEPIVLVSKINEIVKKQGMVVFSLTVLVSLTGYWLIPCVFGADYRDSYLCSIVLMITLLFWALGAPYGQLHIAVNRIRTNFSLAVVQLAVNTVLAFWLIPRYGVEGAAGALCVSRILHCSLQTLLGKRTLNALLKPDCFVKKM